MPLEEQSRSSTGDEALLKEIRENYRYFASYWEEARKERSIDMRYICGDPWEPAERKARVAANRPCISHDELNQYLNQGISNISSNPRGIKAEPRGNGANDQTAELRQNLIRTIEYRSEAQDIYLKTARDMFEGSYGFLRVRRRYVVDSPDDDDPHAFDQEITIGPISNPDAVLYDPNCKEPDWRDAKKVYVVEPLPTDDFRVQYPNAQKRDFSIEDMRIAPDWIREKTILVAEYWKVVSEFTTLKRGGRTRTKEKKKVIQYITNGIEILEEIEQPGTEIPIIPMIGLERYVEEGGSTKRKLFSLCRLARDPQMTLAYLCTQETEEAGQTPKVPYRGYTGAFETDSDGWENLNKDPRSYIQEDPVYDQNGNLLPRVIREQFLPNFQQYELAKDGARRAIQAAIAVSPLPTAAQRNNEKSGVALEKIQDAEAMGSNHFFVGYDRGVKRTGRVIDSWIPIVYDNEREMGLHQRNDTRKVVTLNTKDPYPGPDGKMEQFAIGDEEHDIGISTGPSVHSQREAVDEFLDNLIANLHALPVSPPAAAKLLALAIKMKALGPKGDEMAEIISPSEGDQSQQLQGMQQKMQQQGEILQQMQGELQKLQLERAGKVIEMQGRMALEDKKIEGQVTVAEVNTKAQNLEERMKFIEDLWQQLHAQAHEAGMQAQDQQHQANQSDQDRQAAAMQQQQQQEQQPAQEGVS